MSVTPIQDAQPGEDLIGIAPALSQQVNAGWLHRLAMFNGRALTASALQSEQSYRAGRLAILGQAVTHGVVKGLALTANPGSSNPTLQVTPGYGISASGEDVALLRTLRTTLNSLMVIDPLTGAAIDTFPNYSNNPNNKAYTGVLLLQPIVAQMSGASLDTGPVSQFISGNLGASCDQDSQEYAFADWQIVDGVRLVLVAWPAGLGAPASAAGALGRNALAYTIFNAEMALAPDDRLPWDMLGVPVALAGFSDTWQLLWVDCLSVVRTGGLARSRYVLPATPGAAGPLLLVDPAVAQARVAQLSEQIAASSGLTTFTQSFAVLPPCGVLPAASMNFSTQTGLWFPSGWTLTVEPVHQEEVETALLAGMTARPLDLLQAESVEILVPLPDALYDPDILIQETVAQAFSDAVKNAEEDLTFVLDHRATIQQEANALSQAINGSQQPPPYDIHAGLTAVETGMLGPALPVGSHAITAAYIDTSNNQAAISAALTQSVSSVILSPSANPSVQQQAVTFTAAMANQAATGSVTFFDGAVALGPAQALNGGLATISVSSLSPGTHAITASYGGDANNPANVSPVLPQKILPSAGFAQNLSLSVSPTAPAVGQPVTLTAVFSPPLPGVSVQFLDGRNALGSAVSSASGVALLTVANLAAGVHFLTASAAVSGKNPAVNSPAVVQNVSQAAATVTLSSSANQSALGQGVTFTAVVSPAPTGGSVQFASDGVPLGEPVPLNGGTATLPVFETFGTQPVPGGAYVSQDYQQLIATANNAPYTIFTDGSGNALPAPLPLFSAADMADMAQWGIQHFINRINAKLSQANDLLDLAFLTTQSDIYRFRQYILGSSDATALAVSPIVSQIAAGESAAVTASNLQSYLSSILPENSPVTSTTPPPTTTANPFAPRLSMKLLNTGVLKFQPSSTFSAQISVNPVSGISAGALQTVRTAASSGITARVLSGAAATAFQTSAPGTVSQPATPSDITSQSPLVGAQLNLRTLTIAQRMADPPSQEGIFYATGNRVALLQLLADLDLTIDDLPILVDTPPVLNPPATSTTQAAGAPPAVVPMPLIRDLRDAASRNLIFQAVLNPSIAVAQGVDPDEGDLFSTGIHVLEQHTSLLRSVEGRIQQYQDFLSLCSSTLTSVQTFLTPGAVAARATGERPRPGSPGRGLHHHAAQRRNGAREQRKRTTLLHTGELCAVRGLHPPPHAADGRRRGSQPAARARQHREPRAELPATVRGHSGGAARDRLAAARCARKLAALGGGAAQQTRTPQPAAGSGVPACRSARRSLLTLPPRTSSAASEPGVYAPVIASLFSANQTSVRSFQTERAAFQPAQLVNLSWAAQVSVLQGIASAGDLLSSDSVHAEVSQCHFAPDAADFQRRHLSLRARLPGAPGGPAGLGRISARRRSHDPVAEPGRAAELESAGLCNPAADADAGGLAVPADRYHHPAAAVSFMSDVVRVAILLASDAPVNAVIGGAVTLTTTPTVGGVVSLTLPSERIAQGMYVQLFSAGTLAAQAVVTDLDTAAVRATVTQVYQTGVTLQANDLAHFTSQPPEAAALRAFDT